MTRIHELREARPLPSERPENRPVHLYDFDSTKWVRLDDFEGMRQAYQLQIDRLDEELAALKSVPPSAPPPPRDDKEKP